MKNIPLIQRLLFDYCKANIWSQVKPKTEYND